MRNTKRPKTRTLMTDNRQTDSFNNVLPSAYASSMVRKWQSVCPRKPWTRKKVWWKSWWIGRSQWVERASPCNLTHRIRRVHLTVHGDDFTVVASAKQIAWLGEAMEKRYELKMEVLGPTARQTEEVLFLNRIIRWTRKRHAERIISELELETRKSVSTPRLQESVSATRAMIVEGVEMDDKEPRRFRALAARLNYHAGDRPDLLFSSICICKNVARHRSEDWQALKRVGRYLKGATRMV